MQMCNFSRNKKNLNTYADTVSITLADASLMFFIRLPAPPFRELKMDPEAELCVEDGP